MTMHNYFNGRAVTENGFTKATDDKGNDVYFLAKSGKRMPVMIGVSEFGVKGVKEFIRGENHLKSCKVPVHIILWLADANGDHHGVTIDAGMYRETQANPELYPDRIEKLNEYEIPLTISFK